MAPGQYVVRAPSFSAAQPFGGLLLPAKSSGSIVPSGDELTLTITGGGGDITPPAVAVKTVTLQGKASPNTVSVEVEGNETLDPKSHIWKASVDLPASGKTVEANARNADGATETKRIDIRP